MATSITSSAICVLGDTTKGTTKVSPNLATARSPTISPGTTPITFQDCNKLLWGQLSVQLQSLHRAGCLVGFNIDKTQLYGANRQVVYIYLQDRFEGGYLDMVYSPQTLLYPDLNSATHASLLTYILQFGQDLKLISELWRARLEYSAAHSHKDMPNFPNLVQSSVSDFGDVPSIWGRGDTIPAYNQHSEYFSESGLYDLYCAFPRNINE
jgi:hypothetical protein